MFNKTLIMSSILAASFAVNAAEEKEDYFFIGLSNLSNGSASTEGLNVTGGTDMSEHFGMESTFEYFSDSYEGYYTNVTADSWTISITPVLFNDLNENVRIFARGGFAYGMTTATACNYYACATGTGSEFFPTIGAGVRFMADNGLALRAGYDVNFTSESYTSFNISVGYVF